MDEYDRNDEIADGELEPARAWFEYGYSTTQVVEALRRNGCSADRAAKIARAAEWERTRRI